MADGGWRIFQLDREVREWFDNYAVTGDALDAVMDWAESILRDGPPAIPGLDDEQEVTVPLAGGMVSLSYFAVGHDLSVFVTDIAGPE